ncbi:MAG: 30S ribosomal protein S17 [Candidatus Amesbacteria bacterium GW2011_GWA1_47_16]|uniref:Small ribosomal subunit protein uS17 n=7 Tax=Microgenomates group TaxID=1794810 RepID=A0A0H4TFT8_9BACT|nr:30S ribosomal protein S17, small subunit ribosomal protein S17 [uncultured Microgenomates bacterium Rifle_16ft_4_minimus_1180]AKQ05517.1 30S ribosomal protein S17, small subunit ribosomal protein S17 [uncultured Microgenomates bacterium Rifle_16ft_4_minimus_26042]KKU63237.1 MAG: 30S ribosomal protein S17 [Candidatus Amesbacteria bacterium GW2011_GWC1_47_15]KKU63301.1 MAG: 30S ribosomal protein S17 [Candidatus Amesbacteria bacterium GW2011_GWA1_47_16]KKU96777.1 MAG: 30S ribosomal protein S17 
MKTFTGKVVSAKTPQTAVVEVTRFVAHPVYYKRIRKSKKYHAHCLLDIKEGDTVVMKEIKPMSKTKHFQITEVVK